MKKCTQWRGLKMRCSEKDRTWGITLPEYNVWMSLPGANSADIDVFELKSRFAGFEQIKASTKYSIINCKKKKNSIKNII